MIKHISELSYLKTNHKQGKRKVFLNNEELKNSLTQIAVGFLEKGEAIESHKHPSMWEYFYIITGSGKITINDQAYLLCAGHFFEIPPDTLHSLSASNSETIEFLYWGVQ
jgi:quercetin dioxygenase-like cupin family protein